MKNKYRFNNGTSLYLEPETFDNHAVEFEAASDYLLKHCKNLDSVSIVDVHAGGIQIGGAHKGNPDYILMQRTIKYDFSNFNDIIKTFIADWNSFVDEDVAAFKRFTDEGEKYGWD